MIFETDNILFAHVNGLILGLYCDQHVEFNNANSDPMDKFSCVQRKENRPTNANKNFM